MNIYPGVIRVHFETIVMSDDVLLQIVIKKTVVFPLFEEINTRGFIGIMPDFFSSFSMSTMVFLSKKF